MHTHKHMHAHTHLSKCTDISGTLSKIQQQNLAVSDHFCTEIPISQLWFWVHPYKFFVFVFNGHAKKVGHGQFWTQILVENNRLLNKQKHATFQYNWVYSECFYSLLLPILSHRLIFHLQLTPENLNKCFRSEHHHCTAKLEHTAHHKAKNKTQ